MQYDFLHILPYLQPNVLKFEGEILLKRYSECYPYKTASLK